MRKWKCTFLVQFAFVDNDEDNDRDNQYLDASLAFLKLSFK